MGPYCLGLLTGYLLTKSAPLRLPAHLSWLLWLLLPPLSFTTLLLTYLWNGAYAEPQLVNPSPLVSAVYVAIHRTIWTSLVAWIVFACVTGRARTLSRFLSHSAFVPLSRLSFCVYLSHFPVILFKSFNSRTLLEWSDSNILWQACGNFVVSLLVGYFLYVAFESPIINLERVLLGRASGKRAPACIVSPNRRLQSNLTAHRQLVKLPTSAPHHQFAAAADVDAAAAAAVAVAAGLAASQGHDARSLAHNNNEPGRKQLQQTLAALDGATAQPHTAQTHTHQQRSQSNIAQHFCPAGRVSVSQHNNNSTPSYATTSDSGHFSGSHFDERVEPLGATNRASTRTSSTQHSARQAALFDQQPQWANFGRSHGGRQRASFAHLRGPTTAQQANDDHYRQQQQQQPLGSASPQQNINGHGHKWWPDTIEQGPFAPKLLPLPARKRHGQTVPERNAAHTPAADSVNNNNNNYNNRYDTPSLATAATHSNEYNHYGPGNYGQWRRNSCVATQAQAQRPSAGAQLVAPSRALHYATLSRTGSGALPACDGYLGATAHRFATGGRRHSLAYRPAAAAEPLSGSHRARLPPEMFQVLPVDKCGGGDGGDAADLLEQQRHLASDNDAMERILEHRRTRYNTLASLRSASTRPRRSVGEHCFELDEHGQQQVAIDGARCQQLLLHSPLASWQQLQQQRQQTNVMIPRVDSSTLRRQSIRARAGTDACILEEATDEATVTVTRNHTATRSPADSSGGSTSSAPPSPPLPSMAAAQNECSAL